MFPVNKISSWDIGVNIEVDKLCELYVDMLPTSDKKSIRILWMVEPNEILGLGEIVINRCEEFDLILTWHENILNNCNNSKLFPFGTSWILDFDLNKEKKYSITSIVGGKKITNNHILRQQLPKIVDQIKSIPLELFNSKNYPYKDEPKINKTIQNSSKKNELFYSQFHIVIENVSEQNYFTEKLIDCFQTNTVPIYLGCPNISDFFDIRGIIIVNNIEDIITKCNLINTETYQKMLPYIYENYKKSLKYVNFRETLKNEIINYVKNYNNG